MNSPKQHDQDRKMASALEWMCGFGGCLELAWCGDAYSLQAPAPLFGLKIDVGCSSLCRFNRLAPAPQWCIGTLSGSVAQRTLPGPAESDSAIGAAAFVINTSVEEFFSLIRRKKGRSSSSTTTDELGILARHPSHLPSCKCRNLEVVRMEKRLRRGMLASRNVFYTK